MKFNDYERHDYESENNMNVEFSKLRLMRYNRWSTQILQIMHDLAFYNYN